MQTCFEWGVQFMPFYERKEKILGILSSNEVTTVDEIAEKLYISKPTVRRDLEKLSKSGLVNRTHGGATLIKKYADDKIPFSLREQEQNTAKGIMARKAVEYIEDGYTIMIDGSTSAFAVIPLLSDFKNIIVITNSTKASFMLGQMGIKNICTGGHMINKSFSYVGDDAIRTINNYNADVMFFSCRGLSDKGFLTDNSIEENLVRKAMIKKSHKSVFLCDKSKIGKTYLNNLCHISEVDEFICDEKVPDYILELKNNFV